MHSTELLERGREILDPVLLSHDFRFEPGIIGAGSGGPFARGAYVRGDNRLEFSVRWALGEVIYRVGDTLIPHEELMRVVAGPGLAEYPGFSGDPLDGFRHLKEDLERHGEVFLRLIDADFHAFAERASRTRPGGGFGRLSDVEPG